jgi:hypothetical protein
MAITEGKIPFKVGEETYETYYKIAGDLKDRTRTPLIAIHGGPAFAHNYLLPCVDLVARDIPVIFYDQLGSGRMHLCSVRVPHISHEHDQNPRFSPSGRPHSGA